MKSKKDYSLNASCDIMCCSLTGTSSVLTDRFVSKLAQLWLLLQQEHRWVGLYSFLELVIKVVLSLTTVSSLQMHHLTSPWMTDVLIKERTGDLARGILLSKCCRELPIVHLSKWALLSLAKEGSFCRTLPSEFKAIGDRDGPLPWPLR